MKAVPQLAAGSTSWYTATADLANAMLEQESRTGACGGALELIAPLAANTPGNMPAQVRARVRRAHALAVWREYQRPGDLAGPETDLAEAVRLHRAAAAALDGALEQPGRLVNLGMSLHGMAVHQPDVAAYLEALATFRSAVELARVTSPPQALDAALAWHRLAVDTEPDWDEAAAAADAAVAALLRDGAAATGDPGDLQRAVDLHRAAVAGYGDGPELARYLSNLGGVLWEQYRQSGDAASLKQAAESIELAVAATPPQSPERARHAVEPGDDLR